MRFQRAAALAAVLLSMAAGAAAQTTVVPSDRVVTGVSLRVSATTGSYRIGLLRPGESAIFLGEVPGWYHVEHPTLGQGFVSKGWTRLVADPGDTATATFDVYAVDVATGLAILVRGPDFTLVYDAGSNDDLAGDRFGAFLNEVAPGLTTIDHLVISHAHRDHISMLPDLLAAVQVANIWDSGVMYASCTYQELLEAIATEGAQYHTAIHDPGVATVAFPRQCASTGDQVTLTFSTRIHTGAVPLGANATMTFLHVDGTPRSDLNENSLVVMLELGGTRLLLPGDAGGGEREDPATPPEAGSVERALIDCCAAMLSADILVLGHHGSMTSSREEFLDVVEARDYIVSSGPKRYGPVTLPDEEVVHDVAARPNARVWRTDDHDDACRTNPAKVGNDNDGKAGGCTNIHIHVHGAAGTYEVEVM